MKTTFCLCRQTKIWGDWGVNKNKLSIIFSAWSLFHLLVILFLHLIPSLYLFPFSLSLFLFPYCACSKFTTWPGACIMVWVCLFRPPVRGCPSVHVCSWAVICLTVGAGLCLFPSLTFVSLCSSLSPSELGLCQLIFISQPELYMLLPL